MGTVSAPVAVGVRVRARARARARVGIRVQVGTGMRTRTCTDTSRALDRGNGPRSGLGMGSRSSFVPLPPGTREQRFIQEQQALHTRVGHKVASFHLHKQESTGSAPIPDSSIIGAS